MHKLLEDYLSEAETQLSALPAKRRSEELTEMRQHLLNAVIVNREMGQTEDEAAATAVEQCGQPGEATQGLIRAWQRGQTLCRRDFLGAAACTLLLSLCLPLLFQSFVLPGFLSAFQQPRHDRFLGTEFLSMVACAHFLVGMVSGQVFPRRAVSGTAFAITLVAGFILLRMPPPLFLVGGRYYVNIPPFTSHTLTEALVTILGACFGSWLGTRAKQTAVTTT